jgi:hypothetical protein
MTNKINPTKINTNKTQNNSQKIKSSVKEGLQKGWKGLLWLLKIIVPISFATALLVHFGIIYKLDFLLTPVMTVLALPASAAVVLIIGLFTGIYGTVAALAVMPFSMEHMTLIAVFTLISHNLIQESMVQGNSGINPVFAACFRLVMAFCVTFVCAKIMGATPEVVGAQAAGGFSGEAETFMAMLKSWGWGMSKVTLQIICIIMPLMVLLELGKAFRIIEFITKLTSPLVAVMGLNQSTGFLWLTANIFGLAYGSAVIVEETQANDFKKEDLTRLHLSIGINHAMIEDPILFVPLGLPLLWLWVPRIVAAILAVWMYSAFLYARRLYVKRACHKKLCDH